jgi:SpoVK/Ycf46/Vps4 family AAA+-type ATPase
MLAQRPLYSISMSDIGSDPTVVEKNVQRIFNLAQHGEAMLLFDEADVFLETRDLRDLKRNGLVSVFLHMLEYYTGILFLTTNRCKIFDEAFQSRVHVAIEYKEFQEHDGKSIWEK